MNRVVLDSRIISLNVELRTSDGEVCKPIYQDKYNIRLHFALKSGKNKVMRVSDGSRQLLFHNEETKTVSCFAKTLDHHSYALLNKGQAEVLCQME